jgi:hypothetical protein
VNAIEELLEEEGGHKQKCALVILIFQNKEPSNFRKSRRESDK